VVQEVRMGNAVRLMLVAVALWVADAAAAATPALGSGVRHGVALGADGRVRTWGDDETGVLG